MLEQNILSSFGFKLETSQIFSVEFFEDFKKSCEEKNKPSKALLQALRQLNQSNHKQKQQIQFLRNENKQLKEQKQIAIQQNKMLVQFIQHFRKDEEDQKTSRLIKLKLAYENQAKLSSMIQGLNNQNLEIKQQLDLFKSIVSKNLNSNTNIRPISHEEQDGLDFINADSNVSFTKYLSCSNSMKRSVYLQKQKGCNNGQLSEYESENVIFDDFSQQ